MQSRNKDTDTENKCMDTEGVGEWQGELGDCDGQISTTIIKQITKENFLYSSGNSTQHSVVI